MEQKSVYKIRNPQPIITHHHYSIHHTENPYNIIHSPSLYDTAEYKSS